MKWTGEAEARFEEFHAEVAATGDGADFVFSFEATVHRSINEPATAHSATVFGGEACWQVEFYKRSIVGGIQTFCFDYAIIPAGERQIVWFTRNTSWF